MNSMQCRIGLSLLPVLISVNFCHRKWACKTRLRDFEAWDRDILFFVVGDRDLHGFFQNQDETKMFQNSISRLSRDQDFETETLGLKRNLELSLLRTVTLWYYFRDLLLSGMNWPRNFYSSERSLPGTCTSKYFFTRNFCSVAVIWTEI